MFQMQPTVADRLATNARPAGFDYLRMILALLIMVDHSILACLGEPGQRAVFGGPTRPVMMALVPMFFALSGVLVAGSLTRAKTLTMFAGLRILRIFPALIVETLVTAFIIGVCLTTLPLGSYFTSITFFKYLLNVVGSIHYELPGVFTHNPVQLVNVQLWTIPYEFRSYFGLAALAFFGFHLRRHLLLATTCAITIGSGLYAYAHPLQVYDTWHLLAPSFMFGACAYIYKDRVPWTSTLALVSLVAAIGLLYSTGPLSTLAAIPLVYLTVWFGCLDPVRDPLVRSGDYSYPIYLYSFPIQQALIVVFPWASVWWWNLLAAVPITLALAIFSWHCVEKPFQRLRKYLEKDWIRAARERFTTA